VVARSQTSLAALLLTQRLVDVPAEPLKASEYWTVIERAPDPGSLLGQDAAEIARLSGLPADLAERVARRFDAATAFAFALDEAEQSGLRVVPSTDDDYPSRLVDRLGRGAPPLLYVAGEPGLLSSRLLGIVGSRSVDEAGARVAADAARHAVGQGFGVVSGGAKGVDRLAMNAAIEAGGSVVGVLADSLLRATRDADARRAINAGRLCLCTPYKPSAGFTAANAMGRNKIIYALSEATLVVAADDGAGGTWAGAVEALRHRISPVLVWTGLGASAGNEKLVPLGASPLSASSEVAISEPVTKKTSAQLVMDM
jgi:predicted Rossmann fold nucleotide-binding protein DprA/Smf involved in DNA uptake